MDYLRRKLNFWRGGGGCYWSRFKKGGRLRNWRKICIGEFCIRRMSYSGNEATVACGLHHAVGVIHMVHGCRGQVGRQHAYNECQDGEK